MSKAGGYHWGSQNNLEAKKIHSKPMSTMGVSKQEYWNTGMLEIIFHPHCSIIPPFHYSMLLLADIYCLFWTRVGGYHFSMIRKIKFIHTLWK